MTLKDELNQLLASDKLDKALDLMMEEVKHTDREVYNTLILLKARYTSNEKDNNLGILSREEYKRSKAQINHAFIQIMQNNPNNGLSKLENNDIEKPIKNKDIATQKELEGYKSLLELVIEKKNFLQEELAIAIDAANKFALKKQLKDLEVQIEELKQKVTGEIQKSNRAEKKELAIMNEKLEKELVEVKNIGNESELYRKLIAYIDQNSFSDLFLFFSNNSKMFTGYQNFENEFLYDSLKGVELQRFKERLKTFINKCML